ncbi:uncharacterized protein LOC110692208 [Chenopodium quinoa]|uniref:uncharacterized protein LOC110692208 n=1 Tax=Chenopodium quinoa TaxID=63459 RepID=UPI000B77B234|nr:uncharacterized protein LOC110692208 [Chenopodium quinoa]
MDKEFNYHTFFNVDWESWINYNLGLSENWKTIFAIALWHIWRARNFTVFQKAMPHPVTMFNRYMVDSVANINTFQGNIKAQASLRDKARWERPRGQTIKVNIDGSWRNDGRVGAGAIVRGSDGGWFFGKSWKTKARNPAEAELLAIRGGMQMVIDAGLKDAIIETDAQTLKSTLQDVGKQGTHELSAILKDVQVLLNKGCDFEFNYADREANNAAHYLAKLAVEMDDYMKLYDEPSTSVKDVYEVDRVQSAI